MAKPKSASGRKFHVKIGDGGSPENFAATCTITSSKGFSRTANANEFAIPDCDDPEAPAWIEREIASLSAGITGSGVLNAPDLELFDEWYEDATAKNVKVVVDLPGADGGRIYTGAYLLTQFDLTGNDGEKVTADITLSSSGEVTSAANT